MRLWKLAVVAASGALLLLPTLTIPASAATAPPQLAQSTQDNVTTALHSEAYAHARYVAFGEAADAAGQARSARLFTTIAAVELDRHFTAESDLIGHVGDNTANLQTAIDGETYETTTMYPTFAAQAKEDGCPVAADLFTEIAGDEASHAAGYRAAASVISTGSGAVPAAPGVDAVPFRASAVIACSARTLTNLNKAMRGEAFANANYLLFARQAERTGQTTLATLFRATADVELREHFAGEARLAGLVGDTASTLSEAIANESYEATSMYPSFRNQAAAAGDRAAARLFDRIGCQESRHEQLFRAALDNDS